MSHYGVKLSVWFRLDGDRAITYEITGQEAEFALGGTEHDVCLLATERGLTALIAAARQALADLQTSARDHTEPRGRQP